MPKLYPFKFYNLSRTIKPIKEELWFESHQKLLLRVVNTDGGRELLYIDKGFPKIERIGKNFVTGKLPDGKSITEFRIGAKWANIIRYRWPQFVELARQFYDDKENSLTQIELNGELLWAATTSTFYPDASPETTTVDGRVGHNLGIGSGVAWATLIAAAGNESADAETDHVPTHLVCDTGSNTYRIIRRGIYLFDTSAISDTDTISSATFSIYGNDKQETYVGEPPVIDLNVYSSNPASNTALTGTDYATLGSTAYCDTPINYTNWSTSAYNDYALNATGIAAISKTGVTKLGTRNANYDVSGTALTWEPGVGIFLRGYFADQTGTSNDPKLVVVHAADTAVSPGAGSIAYSGKIPAIVLGIAVAVGVGSMAYIGYAPTVTTSTNSITLTDITDNRIFQRNGTSASITLTGTYTGSPTTIEARIVQDGTSTEVVTWTTIVASPAGGTFSGSITVPQGGWYNAQVRFSNATGIVSNGANGWGVGILIGCIGQSNMHSATTGWFSIGTDHTANTLLRKYTTSGGWQTLSTGNGAISFGNKIITAVSIPVGLLNYGVDGSALRAEAVTSYGYWLDLTAGQPYDLFKTGVTATGGALEFVVWIQGEREANSGVVTEAEYKTSIEDFITNQIRADITNRSSSPNLPFLVSTLGRCTTGSAADWQGIRNALYWVEGNIADTYVGATAIDLALMDVVHLTAGAQTTHGQRMAQTVLDILGNETYHRGPAINYAVQVSTSVVDIYLSHRAGTDFTPTSAITGFEILDSGTPETINTAVRQSAGVVRLTIAETITGTLSVRYLYGANPTITSPVFDNSAMVLPLEVEDVITIASGIIPPTGSIIYTGNTISIPLAAPPSGQLVFSGLSPIVLAGISVFPGTGNIAFSGYIPVISSGITLEGIYNYIGTRLPTASYVDHTAAIEALPLLSEMLAGGVAKESTLTTAQADITSVLTYAIAMSKWKNNRMVRVGVIGTTETWVIYDDDNTTPLLTYTHNTSTKVRTKAT